MPSYGSPTLDPLAVPKYAGDLLWRSPSASLVSVSQGKAQSLFIANAHTNCLLIKMSSSWGIKVPAPSLAVSYRRYGHTWLSWLYHYNGVLLAKKAAC